MFSRAKTSNQATTTGTASEHRAKHSQLSFPAVSRWRVSTSSNIRRIEAMFYSCSFLRVRKREIAHDESEGIVDQIIDLSGHGIAHYNAHN